jgi:hypothetical protein
MPKEYNRKYAIERRDQLRAAERCSNCRRPVLKKVIYGFLKVFSRCDFCLKRMAIFQQEYKERLKNDSRSNKNFRKRDRTS